MNGSLFSLRVMPSVQKSGQIGFVMGKKVAKSAVVRNRTKRQLRAAFRVALEKEQFKNVLNKWYLLVVVHRPLGDKPFEEIATETERLIGRIRPENA